MRAILLASFLLLALWNGRSEAFTPASVTQQSSSTQLYLSTPRRPRRSLQKRRRNPKKSPLSPNGDDEFWQTTESRPIVLERSREQGEDYWIDEEELAREKARQDMIRKREPGQMSNDKLWPEVLAPYRQNWIGLFSVLIVVLTTLVTKFPELLNYPVIAIPDL